MYRKLLTEARDACHKQNEYRCMFWYEIHAPFMVIMLLYGYHAPLWVSCSFMGIMLRSIDVLSYGLAPRVFRPNLGRWAGVVVSGNTAGTQFRQCTTSILGAPL